MSQSHGHIVSLARKILEKAEALESYHTEQHLPLPSLREDGGRDKCYPIELENTRASISDACEELNAIVQGPQKSVQGQLIVCTFSTSIGRIWLNVTRVT